LIGETLVTTFKGDSNGRVELMPYEDSYNVKLIGDKNTKYNFTLSDSNNNEYYFEYYFDKEEKTVILKLVGKE
jgi:hypothetical protein